MKRLNRFLIFEGLLEKFNLMKKWVGLGDGSDHSPILLEIKGTIMEPVNAFKMNSNWLK